MLRMLLIYFFSSSLSAMRWALCRHPPIRQSGEWAFLDIAVNVTFHSSWSLGWWAKSCFSKTFRISLYSLVNIVASLNCVAWDVERKFSFILTAQNSKQQNNLIETVGITLYRNNRFASSLFCHSNTYNTRYLWLPKARCGRCSTVETSDLLKKTAK